MRAYHGTNAERGFFPGALYGDGELPMAAVELPSFVDAMVRVSSSTEDGAGRIRAGFEDYRQALIVAAAASGDSVGLQIREVEKRLGHMALLMAIEADTGMRENAWARDVRVDERQAEMLSALLLAGGVVVAPFGPAGVGALGYAAVVGGAQTIVGELLAGNPCTENFDRARAELAGVIDSQYDADRLLYLRTAESLLGLILPEPPTEAKIGSAPWEAWYEDCRVTVNEAEHSVSDSLTYDAHETPERLKKDRESENG